MTTDMPEARCPECGAPLTPGAAQGLCAHCLMAGAAAPTEHSAPRSTAPALAQVAGAFPQLEVLALIGHGGMGAVFKVRQPKLDRFAALKLLPQSLAADPAFAIRFEREARLLARLNHANIVAIYEFGNVASNSVSQLSTPNSQLPHYYLLMEFVDGVNLRQAMRASRFTPAQALGIVPKICDALQFAHDEGVLHRDIKPENILLDAKGRVKLADFGIAKLIGESAEANHGSHQSHAAHPANLTQSGSTLGTPSYMAPEQRDTPADVDHRADIYSLGVVFYELLTGELPRGSFVQPSAKSDADPRVDAIVRQAMEKERERRQGSAGEMRTQVETLTDRSAPLAGRSEPHQSAASPAPRKAFLALIRRAVRVGAGFVLLTGIVFFGLDGLLPQIYRSQVTMEVKPDNSGSMNGVLRGRERPIIEPQFFSTQFNILQKTEVLYRVIEKLKLSDAWSANGNPMPRQDAYQKLLNMLDLRKEADTGLIEIGVRSTDPQEAANIANTIAIVYQEKRLTDLQKDVNRGLEQLQDEVEKQRKRAEESAIAVAAIRDRENIEDSRPFDDEGKIILPGEGSPDLAARQRAKAGINDYIEAKTRFLQAKRIYEAAQAKHATELLERGIDFDPAAIWEKAEPAIHPTRFSIYRIRHALSR